MVVMMKMKRKIISREEISRKFQLDVCNELNDVIGLERHFIFPWNIEVFPIYFDLCAFSILYKNSIWPTSMIRMSLFLCRHRFSLSSIFKIKNFSFKKKKLLKRNLILNLHNQILINLQANKTTWKFFFLSSFESK